MPLSLPRVLFSPEDVIAVTDHDAVETAIQVMKAEGLSIGMSSGAVAWAALQEARKEQNRGKVIVSVFPSAAERYLQTVLFDDLRSGNMRA